MMVVDHIYLKATSTKLALKDSYFDVLYFTPQNPSEPANSINEGTILSVAWSQDLFVSVMDLLDSHDVFISPEARTFNLCSTSLV
ncbi:hypothetical protein RRG08_021707 [Elysia crispata]|uniref:Uncharacterized protein n=1 Tax=Elysia crispata TaxID=231223 RepID=A0AAE0ZXX6_9GAST|nr:hypothetical protein RRG08_021707 [Elysia crispata]